MSLPTAATRIAGQPRRAGVKLTVFEEPKPVREDGAYGKFVENGQMVFRWVPITGFADGAQCGIVEKGTFRWPVPDNETVDEITSLWPVPEEKQ